MINQDFKIDVQEDILNMYPSLMGFLLADHSTDRNIIWATDNYETHGAGYLFSDEIKPELITGDNSDVIRPRICKEQDTKASRTKDKAEVFTPSWIVNKMNNVIDDDWFGYDGAFNTQDDKTKKWVVADKVDFSKSKDKDGAPRTWQEYVCENRMEITCGEGPYLTSRYDTTTGEYIDLVRRYGIIDRKLRVVNENAADSNEWVEYAKKAYQSTYGYEWSGDNLLIARENMFATFIDNYKYYHNGEKAPIELIEEICEIISWNIFQMDGIKMVIPNSCHDDAIECVFSNDTLFEDGLFEEPLNNDGQDNVSEKKMWNCAGCEKNNIRKHNGIYAITMDWENKEPIKVVDMI